MPATANLPFSSLIRRAALALAMPVMMATGLSAAPAEGPQPYHPAQPIIAQAVEFADQMQDPEHAQNLRQVLAISLVEMGQGDEALSMAFAQTDPVEQLTLISVVTLAHARNGNIDDAHYLLQQIDPIAATLPPVPARALIFDHIARAQSHLGQAEAAFATGSTIADGMDRMLTLAHLAASAPDAATITRLVDAINTIDPETGTTHEPQVFANYRTSVLSSMTEAMAEIGGLEEALALSEGLQSDDARQQSIGWIASGLVQSGHTSRALDLINQHDSAADMDLTLSFFAERLVEIQDPDLAQLIYPEILNRAGISEPTGTGQVAVARFLRDAAQMAGEDAPTLLAQARPVIDALPDTAPRAMAQATLAALLTEIGETSEATRLFTDALAAARTIERTSSRADTLTHIAAELWAAGQTLTANDVLEEAIQTTATVRPALYSTAAQSITHIGAALMAMGDTDRALQAYMAGMDLARERTTDRDRFIATRIVIEGMAAEF